MIIRSETENKVNGEDTARADRAASAGPTLDELAQRLLLLRQHLDEVLDELDRATRGRQARTDESLRCHACSRIGSIRQAGWTLRLCGDDELHPFCPDCDRRNAAGDGRNGTHFGPTGDEIVSTVHLSQEQPLQIGED